jgi:glycosyltransferase involved in cell wall biosynthesis
MRICFLLHQGNVYSGGQGVYTYHVTREMARLGNEVHLIMGPPYMDVAEGVRVHKVKTFSVIRLLETGRFWFYGREPLEFFHPLNLYELATSRAGMFSVMAAFSFRAYQRYRELAREQPFDIVHDDQGLGYGSLLVRASGVPVVANIHHPLSIDRRNAVMEAPTLRQKVRRILFYPFFMQEVVARRLDRIITGSQNSAESVGRAFRLPPGHISVIHDGVDTDTFRPREDVAKGPNSILFVGNSDDRNKGARYLLEALHLLRDKPDLHLTVVDRPIAQMVPQMVERLGLHGRVTLTGRVSREDLVRLYCSSQLLVSPSLYEGFGLPAAEAMACGLPVIATTAGAFPEIIEDGVSGVLVPPGDTAALADAVRRLMADAQLREELGRAARKRITETFSWRETAVRTLALYQEVISGRTSRRRAAL